MIQNLRAKAASKAKVRLAQLHPAEYQKLYAEECELLGLQSRTNQTQILLLQQIEDLQKKIETLETLNNTRTGI